MENDITPSFNVTHPELRPGEKFLMNILLDGPYRRDYETVEEYIEAKNMPDFSKDEKDSFQNQFKDICYHSKRIGEIAYSVSGEINHYCRPVFVKVEEEEKSLGEYLFEQSLIELVLSY